MVPCSMRGRPELLNARQDRPGQRASLAHAAAAGGAVRIAPQLMLAMHAAKLKEEPDGLVKALAREEKGATGAHPRLTLCTHARHVVLYPLLIWSSH
jgi:hypothetical protein